MSLKDYAHWNEDARAIWWQEEGRHVEEPPDPYDDPIGVSSEYDDVYDEGYYDAENGETSKVFGWPPRLRQAYRQGYADGSHEVEEED